MFRETSTTTLVDSDPIKAEQEVKSNGRENVAIEDLQTHQGNQCTPGESRTEHFKNDEIMLEENNPGKPSRDRFTLVTVILFLQGVGTLYPWNSFLTVEQYFTDEKLANVSDGVEYKDKFNLYVAYGYLAPYLLFLLISLFFPASFSKRRCLFSLIAMLLLYIITTILAVVDTSKYPEAFFGITMVTVMLFSVASAVSLSGMYAITAKLPGNYSIGSYIAGQGFGGTCVALFTVVSTASTTSLRGLAIMHFTIACIILFICVITYCLLFKLSDVKSLLSCADVSTIEIAQSHSAFKNFWDICGTLRQVFKDIKIQLFNVWMTFFLTAQFFPEVLGNIASSNIPEISPNFRDKYFIVIACFLNYNVCDFVGNLLATVPLLNWKYPRWTFIIVLLRLAFIFFIFCNYRPHQRSLPVVLKNDIVYSLLVVVFSLSSGYLKTTTMDDGINSVSHPALKSKAGSMMAFFLVLGIVSGVVFSRAYPQIIQF